MRLDFFYCVYCGSDSSSPICNRCTLEETPATYQFNHTFYCTFCRSQLHPYFDFHKNKHFKSLNYRCFGCEAVEENPDFNKERVALPAFYDYARRILLSHPPKHIKSTLETQLYSLVQIS